MPYSHNLSLIFFVLYMYKNTSFHRYKSKKFCVVIFSPSGRVIHSGISIVRTIEEDF